VLQTFFKQLIHIDKKENELDCKANLELIGKLESGISVASVCEEYGHLDLTDIRQYRAPLPPN
jgi:hypothetical protein